MRKWLYSLVLIILALFVTTACGTKDNTEGTLENINYKETESVTNYVKIEMRRGDIVLVELDPDSAPITVENFQKLVSEKFYDGITFHRVMKNFMIQGGDPQGTGIGGSKETIKGEFEINGIENNILHKRGVISMARKGPSYGAEETSETMDSASSQFFIMHADYPSLDGSYAAFGNVIAGMSAVDKIAEVETDNNDKPIVTQVIKSIRFVEVERS